jgi:hypothetical protein
MTPDDEMRGFVSPESETTVHPYQPSVSIRLCTLGGLVVLLDLRVGRYLIFDAVASYMWNLLVSEADHEQRLDSLAWDDKLHSMQTEFRHPLMYLPLVEFMYSISWDVQFCPSSDRTLHRAAFADLLPLVVARRDTKPDRTRRLTLDLRQAQSGCDF